MAIERFPAREVSSLPCAHVNSCQTDASCEPLVNLANIQGNIVAGFNKDFQMLLFLEITDSEAFRDWLRELVPWVATSREVLIFNRLYKEIRGKQGESCSLTATWLNVAFSYKALKQLAPVEEMRQFKDEAFRAGLCKRSSALGDPSKGPGSPETWMIGGPGNEADVLLIFAADREADLNAEVDRIERSILRVGSGGKGGAGARILCKERGAVLPPPLKGHEHFGFLDGISQPGLRGRISENPHDVLTLRQNPRSRDQGKPGQDLVWPGEFIFGYPGQDPLDATKEGSDSLCPSGHRVAPEWARDGSYLVFRRLNQDVARFRSFLSTASQELDISVDLLAAKVVGRFQSGAPIMRTQVEDPPLGGDDCANNDFEFSKSDDPPENGRQLAGGACQCKVLLPEPEPDDEGVVCPYAAHIRKVYPRNDRGRFPGQAGESTNQKHRLIRRGIPFGPPYPVDSESGSVNAVERGLLFLAYQTSIVEQFEYIQKTFASTVEMDTTTGEVLAGYDPIIGQDKAGKRPFVVPRMEEGRVKRRTVNAGRPWTLPTGGGYFFAPSIKALKKFSRSLE
jgi:Dyp-type peroxidase family